MLTNIDFIAFIWFLFCWLGYSIIVQIYAKNTNNIHGLMHQHRFQWMEHCIFRADRSEDLICIGNMMRSITFFASASVLVIAALIPLLSYGDKAGVFIASLPYTITNLSPIWELKTLLLIVIFTYAFFKYSWALRQYNYASTMLLATLHPAKKNKETKYLINRNADILSNAARHFSMGIRSYYYAIVVLSWYLNPYLFIIATTLVTMIITRREFMSKALDIISGKKQYE